MKKRFLTLEPDPSAPSTERIQTVFTFKPAAKTKFINYMSYMYIFGNDLNQSCSKPCRYILAQ